MKKAKPTTKNTGKTLSKRAQPGKLTRAVLPEVPIVVDEASLLSDLRALIQSARQRVATVANSTQTMLCWYVGDAS